MVISTIVVEDNEAMAELLMLRLKDFNNINVLMHLSDKKSAVEAIKLHKPDLLFMDINIKGGSGLDVLNACKDHYGFVVFVTSYDEFALKSFEYNTVHYLLKPYKEEALEEVITKVEKYFLPKFRLDSLDQKFLNSSTSIDEKIFLPEKSSMTAVSVNSIVYLESARSYCDVHSLTSSFKLSKNLTQMHKQLEKFENFVRIHRSFVVNINHIKNVKRGINSTVQLSNGATLPVSNNEKAILFKTLGITD